MKIMTNQRTYWSKCFFAIYFEYITSNKDINNDYILVKNKI